MALRQTTESRDPYTAFVPSGSYVDLGPYKDIVFNHDVKSAVSIDLECRLPSTHTTVFGLGVEPGWNARELSMELEFGYLPSIDQIYLVQSVLDIWQGFAQVHKESAGSNQSGQSYRTSVNIGGEESVDLADFGIAKFHVLPPIPLTEMRFTELEKSDVDLFSQRGQRLLAMQCAKIIEELVPQELANFCYVGPLRERPQRIYLSTGETPREVGIAGELGPAVLWSALKAEQLNSDRLSEWCKRMGLAFKIDLAPVEGGYFRVLVTDAHSGLPVNLPDVGFGTSQLLPHPYPRSHSGAGSDSAPGATPRFTCILKCKPT